MPRAAITDPPRTAGLSAARRWLPCLAVTLLLACRSTAPASPAADQSSYVPYLELRKAHQTTLVRPAPPPVRNAMGDTPPGAELVTIQSGELALGAWFAKPEGDGPFPGLVYFHGSFALDPHDFEAVEGFVDRGFAVLTPTLRGENGNPGELELLYGEVDDGIAAVEWLATREDVDRERVVAVGHSVGGAVAALLSLHPEAPLLLTASVGGIYVPETFQRWRSMKGNGPLVRFDPFDPAEGRLRTLGPNVRDIVRLHVAYVGEDDQWFHDNVESVAEQAKRHGVPFDVVMVPGDHMSSLEPGLQAFAERVVQLAPTAAAAARPEVR